MEGIRFILADAANPYNIGASARAIANFGFDSLALVNVFKNDYEEAKKNWLAEAAVSAVDSFFVLEKALFLSTIPQAAAGCDVLFGTSSLHYQVPERPVIPLHGLRAFIAEKKYRSAGIVFGCEKHGLTKEELGYCNYIINIPTDPRQPSINLGQAVAVTAYELSGIKFNAGAYRRKEACPEEIFRFALEIQEALIKKDGPHWKEKTRLREIRQALTDAHMTSSAVNALKALLH